MKLVLLVIFSFLLISCEEKNALWYWNHPLQIKPALDKCPKIQPQGVSCEQLQSIYANMIDLMSEMRHNPAEFGQAILTLENKIALQKQELKNHPEKEDIKLALEKNQQEVVYRLIIIKLQASPKA